MKNGDLKIDAGDVTVIDNCGFHHAPHVEPILRQMLLNHGVMLVYQPPYSLELNPCEYVFNHIKYLLKNNERFSVWFTELAIVNAMEFITCIGRKSVIGVYDIKVLFNKSEYSLVITEPEATSCFSINFQVFTKKIINTTL